jgi:hypothetical protein
MGKPLEQVAQEIVQLPEQQKLALAGLILALDEVPSHPDAETLRGKEIQARIKAIDAGMTSGVAREEVMREADARLDGPEMIAFSTRKSCSTGEAIQS